MNALFSRSNQTFEIGSYMHYRILFEAYSAHIAHGTVKPLEFCSGPPPTVPIKRGGSSGEVDILRSLSEEEEEFLPPLHFSRLNCTGVNLTRSLGDSKSSRGATKAKLKAPQTPRATVGLHS